MRDFIAAAGLPVPLYNGRQAPSYTPEKWIDGRLRYGVNCYGYALGVDDWLTLGSLDRAGRPDTVCVRFNKAVGDGLIPAPQENPPDIEGYYLVALVDGKGWHWYRKDADGSWSHKDGEGMPSKLDAAGLPITDPKTADRGPYTNFIGYFYTPCR